MTTVSDEDPVTHEGLELAGMPARSRVIAVGSLLAALYAVTVMVPISAFIGASSVMSASIFIAPLFGVILGPRYGGAFGLVAGVLAAFVSSQFGGLYLIVPTIILGPAVSGLLTGLCLRPKTMVRGVAVPGPLLTALYLLMVIAIYLVTYYEAWWFVAPYAFTTAVALLLQRTGTGGGVSPTYGAHLRLVALMLVGTMTDLSMITLGAIYLLDLPASVYGYVILPVMLLERTAAVIMSTLIAKATERMLGQLTLAE